MNQQPLSPSQREKSAIEWSPKGVYQLLFQKPYLILRLKEVVVLKWQRSPSRIAEIPFIDFLERKRLPDKLAK